MNKIFDLTLVHPSRFIIYGPSGSGKTTFVEKLMTYMKELFGFNFNKIFYCSGQFFPNYKSIHSIEIIQVDKIDLTFFDTIDPNEKNLIILDDNMHSCVNDLIISDLFTKKSHHLNITVILLLQNLFPKSKYMRDITINSTYIVLLSNPRETLSIKTLSSQIDGSNPNFVLNCFLNATKDKPYSYLFLDFEPHTPEDVRVRTNIFPNEEHYTYIKLS